MSIVDTISDHVREHRSGMVSDLVFALVWVTIVELFFNFVDGPTWARYLLLVAGIPAYFGFVYSLELAKEHERDRSA